MKKKLVAVALLGIIGLAAMAQTCTIINTSLTTIDGKSVFAGELKNESGANILNHKVRVTFINGTDVLETKTVDPCLRSMKNNSSSYFAAVATGNTATAGLARMANLAEDSNFKVGTTVNGDFEITVDSVGHNLDDNTLTVSGTITNNGSDDADDPRICVVVRDNGGRVVHVRVNTSVPDLEEDDVENWTIEFAGMPDSTSTIAKVDVHADALTEDNEIMTPESVLNKEVDEFGDASKLAFEVQPVDRTGGQQFTNDIKVKVVDEDGETVTSATNEITLAIGDNPSAGTLTCLDTSVAAVAGVATFEDCSVDKVGADYTLSADSGSAFDAVESNAFDVTVGAAAKLAFTTQPSATAAAGAAFAQQPVVTVQDAGGNTVTTATNSVTLAVSAGTLGCTNNTVAAAAGIATFADCDITPAADNLKLTASATGLTSATSNEIDITP